jgi:uncharacterized RDD family membrane protein YckC
MRNISGAVRLGLQMGGLLLGIFLLVRGRRQAGAAFLVGTVVLTAVWAYLEP